MYALNTYDVKSRLLRDGYNDTYFPKRKIIKSILRSSITTMLITSSPVIPQGAMSYIQSIATEVVSLKTNIIVGLDEGAEEKIARLKLNPTARTIILPYTTYRSEIPLRKSHYEKIKIHKIDNSFLKFKELQLIRNSNPHRMFYNYQISKLIPNTNTVIAWYENAREPLVIRIAKHLNIKIINIYNNREAAENYISKLRETCKKI